eukprot:gb/GECG01002832.1/.p1 GENE.gb/GECG01002832.1/~~gb/GECG01002832.1/.p1  ORF type:complete len:555 (+),score=93.36 gb/GECG01002832.1/:1-1665(+)
MPPVSKKKRRKDAFGVPENVPAFLRKTYAILNTPAYSDIVYWGKNGHSIVIDKVTRFSTEVLPNFFKHSNYASFVRQLNMYGFYKVSPDPSCREFMHKLFKKDRPDLLTYIKRKSASNMKTGAHETEAPEEPEHEEADIPSAGGSFEHETFDPSLSLQNGRRSVDSLLDEMVALKQRQKDLEKELEHIQHHDEAVQRENSQLWEELQKSRARQIYMRSKMQRLVGIMYEMYKALSMTNQLANSTRASLPDENGASFQQPPYNTENDAKQQEVVNQLFCSDGILSPEQFTRMLDYLNIGPQTFSSPSLPSDSRQQDNKMHLLTDKSPGASSSQETLVPRSVGMTSPAAAGASDTPPFAPSGASDSSTKTVPTGYQKQYFLDSDAGKYIEGQNGVENTAVLARSRPDSPGKDTSSSGSEGVGRHYEERPLKKARKTGEVYQTGTPEWQQRSLPLLSTEQEQLADAEHTTMSNIYGIEHALQSSFPSAYYSVKDNGSNEQQGLRNISAENDDDNRSVGGRSSIFGGLDGLGSPGANSWAAIGQNEFGLTDLDEPQDD